MRIVWQGFTHPVENRPYVDRLLAYLREIAAEGVEWRFAGIDPPDRYLHRMTELRCSVQAVASAIEAERGGADCVVMGHFQDAGLYEARAALDIPVVGLGETSMLYALQLGRRFGLVTIDPVFVRWHEEQVARYALDERFAGVRSMETSVELFMRAFEDDEPAADVRSQFEAQARLLVEAGAEVIVPAGGLPALLFQALDRFAVDGAVVLNPTAVAAKQAEVAVALHRLNGTGPARIGTFARPSDDALAEFLAQAGRMRP